MKIPREAGSPGCFRTITKMTAMLKTDDHGDVCESPPSHGHCSHCEWVDLEIEERKRLRDKWDKVFWAVIATLSGGAALSFFGLLAWAFKTYIERGGR